ADARGGASRVHGALLSRLGALPGVRGAAGSSLLPLQYRAVDTTAYDLEMEGRPPRRGSFLDHASFRLVSPGYFEVLRTPLVAGRAFTDADTTGQPAVAIVNETMARLYWPDGAVGRRFTLQRRFGRIDPLRLPPPTRETPIPLLPPPH